MRIVDVIAYPISVPIPADRQNTLGLGKLTKRDAIIVKVVSDEGVIGWGEAHHARNPGTVAHLINTTMRDLVLGMDPTQTTVIWTRMYRAQVGSHGMGAGSVIAMSGIDMALWDLKGKLANMPLYKLLGGAQKPIPAYAGGGGALGFRSPEETADEVGTFVDKGFKAVKLRLGQTNKQDIARISAVRDRFPDLAILTDANTAYTLDDCRRVMPAMQELDVYWLEEPFPATNTKAYEVAATFSSTPLALGENSYTRLRVHPAPRIRQYPHLPAGCRQVRRRHRDHAHRRHRLDLQHRRAPAWRRHRARSRRPASMCWRRSRMAAISDPAKAATRCARARSRTSPMRWIRGRRMCARWKAPASASRSTRTSSRRTRSSKARGFVLKFDTDGG